MILVKHSKNQRVKCIVLLSTIRCLRHRCRGFKRVFWTPQVKKTQQKDHYKGEKT